MKKIIITFLLIFPFLVFSQSYIGFNTDNYNGVHGVLFNPANIVDSKFKTDINLVSASVALENDYIGINMKDLFNDGTTDFENDSKRNLTDNNNFQLNTDVLGPAFMLSIKPKHSIAMYSRARVFLNTSNINGKLYERFTDENFNSQQSFTASDNGFNNVAHGWGEIGFSYATVLIDKKQHFLKAGVTFKYLQGLGSSAIQSKNIHVDYNPSAIGFELDTQGELTYASSFEENGDFEIQSGATGSGFDTGFVYEWRPENESNNKYKLKLGVAITDIGSIKYETTQYERYTINGVNIDESIFENNDLQGALDVLVNTGVYSKVTVGNQMEVNLPTALHIQADWNVKKNWFLNFNTSLSLTNVNDENTNAIINRHTITPRFETKWFTAQIPISTTALDNTMVGFGFRVGPLFLGSGSIISNMTSNDSRAIDAYVGVKIPIYKKRKKKNLNLDESKLQHI